MRYVTPALHILVGHKAVSVIQDPPGARPLLAARVRLALSCSGAEASPAPACGGGSWEGLWLPGNGKEKGNTPTLCDQSHTDIH